MGNESLGPYSILYNPLIIKEVNRRAVRGAIKSASNNRGNAYWVHRMNLSLVNLLKSQIRVGTTQYDLHVENQEWSLGYVQRLVLASRLVAVSRMLHYIAGSEGPRKFKVYSDQSRAPLLNDSDSRYLPVEVPPPKGLQLFRVMLG